MRRMHENAANNHITLGTTIFIDCGFTFVVVAARLIPKKAFEDDDHDDERLMFHLLSDVATSRHTIWFFLYVRNST